MSFSSPRVTLRRGLALLGVVAPLAALEACDWIAGIPDGTPRTTAGDGALGDGSGPDAVGGDGASVDAAPVDVDAEDAAADTSAPVDADAQPPLACAPFEERVKSCGVETADVCRDRAHCGDGCNPCGATRVCWRGACVDPDWQYWPQTKALVDASTRFTTFTSPDGGSEVRDALTSLTWQRRPDPSARPPEQLAGVCTQLGRSYRVPSRVELVSIADYSRDEVTPAILSPYFETPGRDASSPWEYYTTTRCAPLPGTTTPRGTTDRLAFVMVHGAVVCDTSQAYVRCVR